MDPLEEYHPFSLMLSPGDEIVLYTDGVNEAMNRKNELFGTMRLCDVLAAPARKLDERVRAIVDRVEQFCGGRSPSDDTCIVALSRLMT